MPRKYSREWMQECQQLIRDQRDELDSKEATIEQLSRDLEQAQARESSLREEGEAANKAKGELVLEHQQSMEAQILKYKELDDFSNGLQMTLEQLRQETEKKDALIR